MLAPTVPVTVVVPVPEIRAKSFPAVPVTLPISAMLPAVAAPVLNETSAASCTAVVKVMLSPVVVMSAEVFVVPAPS